MRVIIGSGIDVIDLARVERALERHGARFERRVFHPREIESCRRRRRPALHYAERFAAKEAVMKAVGTGWSRGVRWVDIEVLAGPHGAGTAGLRLHGAVEGLARRQGATRLHLGTGRSRAFAYAAVLLESESK